MQLALLCSIDTLLASAGVGLVGSPISRRRLVLAFAMSDSIASLAGASLHSIVAPLYPSAFAPPAAGALLTLGTVAILVYIRKFPATLLVSIPILLGLDNFISGLVQGSTHPVQFALLAGLASSLFAWMGLAIARLVSPSLSGNRSMVTGSGLIALAFVLQN